MARAIRANSTQDIATRIDVRDFVLIDEFGQSNVKGMAISVEQIAGEQNSLTAILSIDDARELALQILRWTGRKPSAHDEPSAEITATH